PIRYRPSDDSLVWAHEEDQINTPSTTTLNAVIEYLLASKSGRSSMYGDDRQFFLLLALKRPANLSVERQLSKELITVLDRHSSELSTAVGPTDGPRGITVIISGDTTNLRNEWLGPRLNRLCIVEGVDYGGQIVPRSPFPFQWKSYDLDNFRGRVNDDHRERE